MLLSCLIHHIPSRYILSCSLGPRFTIHSQLLLWEQRSQKERAGEPGLWGWRARLLAPEACPGQAEGEWVSPGASFWGVTNWICGSHVNCLYCPRLPLNKGWFTPVNSTDSQHLCLHRAYTLCWKIVPASEASQMCGVIRYLGETFWVAHVCNWCPSCGEWNVCMDLYLIYVLALSTRLPITPPSLLLLQFF